MFLINVKTVVHTNLTTNKQILLKLKLIAIVSVKYWDFLKPFSKLLIYILIKVTYSA